MKGFRTQDSIYKIDLNKKTITGGIFSDGKEQFVKASIMPGLPALIELADGQIVQTNTVQALV